MRKILLGLAFLAFATASYAANVNIDGLPAAASVVGSSLLECEQGGVNNKCTATQTAAYIYGLMSGDATATGLGALTLKNTGPGATGPLGSATVAPIVTIDAQGRVTGLTSATITPAVGSVTGLGSGVATALGIAPGTTGSFATQDGAITTGNCLKWGPGVQDAGAVCGSGGGGSPGGSNTQVQYNNAGSFGGITGATTNGTALTLVAPILGTPASGTLTNTTGFPVANLSGAGTGVLTFLATPSSANLASALTDETGTGAAVFAGSPALTGTPTAPTATVGTNTTQLATTAFVLANGSSAGVASATGGPGITVTGTGSPATGAITISGAVTARNNTGTTDTLLAGDSGTVVTESNSSPVLVGIAVASTSGFTAGNYWTVKNLGAGLVTIQPTTSTIGGASTATIKQGQSLDFYSDGTNYITLPGRPINVAPADLTAVGTGVATALGVNVGSAGAFVTFNGALGTPSSGTLTSATGLPISTGVSGLGTGVATAAAANLSAAGGLTTTIASGTAVLNTAAVASGACETVVTSTATNVVTTDVVHYSYNGDPTAVTGYGASATGAVLSIYPYPGSGNVNVKVCNSTANSITPSAMTLNWQVTR